MISDLIKGSALISDLIKDSALIGAALLAFCRLQGMEAHRVQAVARSKQVCIEWLEATALLSIYLRGELILIATKVLPASCFLADVPSSACETPPPRHHLATTSPPHTPG